MEGLKDDAYMTASEEGEVILVKVGNVLAGDAHRAAVGALQAGDDGEHCRFSRSAGPYQADRFAGLNKHVKSAQYMHPSSTAAEAQMHIRKINRRLGHVTGNPHMRPPQVGSGALQLPSDKAVRGNVQLLRNLTSCLFRLTRSKAVLLALAVLTAIQMPPAHAATVKILAFGDSLTAGLGLAQTQAFPARLQAALRARGHDVEIVDAGVSGDTAASGLARIDWSLGTGAHGVILELGANDALRGVDPALTRAALDELVARLTARGIKVLLAGMRAPPNMGKIYARAFDAIYPQLAQKHGLTLYPFFLDGVATNQALNQDDGIHPNAAGVEIIVKGILPQVEALIARIRAKASN